MTGVDFLLEALADVLMAAVVVGLFFFLCLVAAL